jgi:serine/threonine-protein kinase HipA
MPKTRLLEENGRAHFMIRRFDRIDDTPWQGARKIHMQSLCAMDHVDFNLLHTNSYSSLITVIRKLNLGEDAVTEAFRRMAFNYMAMNCDDHSKNFSFLMDDKGIWRLAPAYDITYAYNSQNIWLREHLMGIDGKFSGVTQKEMLRFAERHEIRYARSSLKEVQNSVAGWQHFAARAALSPDAIDAIAKNHFFL